MGAGWVGGALGSGSFHTGPRCCGEQGEEGLAASGSLTSSLDNYYWRALHAAGTGHITEQDSEVSSYGVPFKVRGGAGWGQKANR